MADEYRPGMQPTPPPPGYQGPYITPPTQPATRTPPPLRSSTTPYTAGAPAPGGKEATQPFHAWSSVPAANFGAGGRAASIAPFDYQTMLKALAEEEQFGRMGPEGLNMMVPGYGEQRYRDTATQYNKPLAGEEWWQQNKGRFGQSGMGSQYIQGVLEKPPGLPDADMAAYYENAKRRAAEGINAEMAARGAWGSSAATDRISEAFTDLEADRALKEAQYGLDRSGLERGWTETLGGLGLRADEQRLADMLGGGRLSEAAGGQTLERLGAGQRAAGMAQEMARARGQDYLDSTYREADTMGGIAGDTYEDMLSTDMALLEAEMAARMGVPTEALQAALRAQGEGRQDKADNMAMLAGLYKLGREGRGQGWFDEDEEEEA